MRATANSRIVNKTRMMKVIRAMEVLMFIKARVAPPIRCINR